ncbi:MAG: hemerythrin domain-containing protein [Campylobacterales bacterium]|nr:hemerythrin domain-containing protein [Campylobacterales bacterium]
MGFIKDLLHRLKKKNDIQPLEEDLKATHESINYNAQLINMLENDHEQLFTLYHQIQEQFAQDSNFKQMQSVLNDFKLALEIHLMVENTQLYDYIRYKNKENNNSNEFVDSVQDEMKTIADNAMAFIQKYSTQKGYEENIDHFLEDLSKIGITFSKRIIVEESKLYPLYIKNKPTA